MTREEALNIVKSCIEIVNPAAAEATSEETFLVDDGLLDSLDAMAFVFNIEKKLGRKLKSVTTENTTFSVSDIIKEIQQG